MDENGEALGVHYAGSEAAGIQQSNIQWHDYAEGLPVGAAGLSSASEWASAQQPVRGIVAYATVASFQSTVS